VDLDDRLYKRHLSKAIQLSLLELEMKKTPLGNPRTGEIRWWEQEEVDRVVKIGPGVLEEISQSPFWQPTVKLSRIGREEEEEECAPTASKAGTQRREYLHLTVAFQRGKPRKLRSLVFLFRGDSYLLTI
jgi:hypothetical protein